MARRFILPDWFSKYSTEIKKYPNLTSAEEAKLAKKFSKGDLLAKEKLIQSNLKLVIRIALSYAEKGGPIADLIAEGNTGLIRAVEKFDPTKGARLSTYAGFWITQSMKKAMIQSLNTIHIPTHVLDKITKIRKISQRLSEDLGREATLEEISQETGLSVEKISILLTSSQSNLISIDQMIPGTDTDIGSCIPDTAMNSASEEIEMQERLKELRDYVDRLPAREKSIIIGRYGLNEQNPLTLDELGIKHNLTRERVRQLQHKALDTIKEMMEAGM